MTARKNLKRLIRQRMRRTGESYTAARRHFLIPKEPPVNRTTSEFTTHDLLLGQSIDELHLTLKTSSTLKSRGIRKVGELIRGMAPESGTLGLEPICELELRAVLASRGLPAN